MKYNSNKFTVGAHFVVPSSLITNKSLLFWKALLDLHILDTEREICSQTLPNTLEQSWIDIFNYEQFQ